MISDSKDHLKNENYLFYIKIQRAPRGKHSLPRLKNNMLTLYKAEVAVSSDIRIKHTTQSENRVEYLNVIPGGTTASVA